MIHTFTLRHRLYAYTVNAAGIRGGSNAPLGELDAVGKVPANVIETIDALLASISPEGSSAAYAVQRFDAPGETNSFLCLVASHPTVDVDQRPASLNHARILCIDSAEAWLDIQALIGLAETFQIGSLLNRSPGEIRDQLLDTESSVTAGDWNDTPLRTVDAPLAQMVIETCLSSVNRQETQVVPLPRQETPLDALRGVAAAWCSLPWAIQRASSFSIASLAGTRVKLLFTAPGQSQRPAINGATRDFAASYIEWLLDRPDDARAMIVNPAIHDAQTLSNLFQQSNQPRAPAPPREEPEMAKNKRPAEAPRGELNQAVIGYINEQIATAEDSLRDYVDKWRSSSAEPRTPRAPSSGVSPAAPPRRGIGEYAMAAAAGAVGGAVVALLIVFLMRPQAPRPITRQSDTVAAQPVHETTRDAAPAVQPPTPVRADALPGANWANRFLWLSENAPKRLSSVVTSIAGGDAMLSGEMEKSLTPIRAQLDAGTPLAPADRKLLRGILFQMLARQISGRDFKIDGRFASVPGAAVTAVRNELHLESKAANSDDIANFEGEAVLKWAARENL